MNQTVDEDGDSLVDFILFQPKLTAKEEGSYQVSWAEIKQPKENNLIYYSRFLLDMTELKDHSNLFAEIKVEGN